MAAAYNEAKGGRKRMATTVYLVIGEEGSYYDYEKWVVAAYTTREQAEEHCQRLRETLKGFAEDWHKIRDHEEKHRAYEAWQKRWNQARPLNLDPKVIVEAEYHVEEVVLVRHVDEFLETS
jgi:hypothetical protein